MSLRPETREAPRPDALASRLVTWSARYATPLLVLPLLAYIAFNCFDPLARNNAIDLDVYRAAGEAVRDGHPLYAGPVTDLNFNYPPFAALLFVPMTLVPQGALPFIWFAVNLALLAYVIAGALSLMGSGPGSSRLWRASIGLTGLMLWLQPVTWGLVLGQVNLVLAAAIMWDGKNAALSGSHRWYRGVLIGVVTGMRLLPGLFIVYLLVIRKTRAALMAGAGFMVTVAVGFIALPRESRWYWWGHFADVTHIDGNNHDRDVQSLAATISRLLDRDQPPTALWLILACLLGAAGLAVAAQAHRKGRTLLGLTLCGLTAEVVSPFSWSHHWVWLVPLTLIVVTHATRRSRRYLALTVTLVTVCLAAWPLGYLTHDRFGPILGTLALPVVEPFDVVYGNLYLWLYLGAVITSSLLKNQNGIHLPGSSKSTGP